MPAFPDAKKVDLADLATGEDFGARFTDTSADWTGSDAIMVVVKPDGTEEELTGTVSVDGTEATFTVLGSTTEGWAVGRWSYAFWILPGGGSRQMLVTGKFRVYDAVGEIP